MTNCTMTINSTRNQKRFRPRLGSKVTWRRDGRPTSYRPSSLYSRRRFGRHWEIETIHRWKVSVAIVEWASRSFLKAFSIMINSWIMQISWKRVCRKRMCKKGLKRGQKKGNSSIKHNQIRVRVYTTRTVSRLLWINSHFESCRASEDVKTVDFWVGEGTGLRKDICIDFVHIVNGQRIFQILWKRY